MRQRLLNYVVGMAGGFGGPIAEGRAEPVRRQGCAPSVPQKYALRRNDGQNFNRTRMLLDRIELSTSPLPRGCSTTELQQQIVEIFQFRQHLSMCDRA